MSSLTSVSLKTSLLSWCDESTPWVKTALNLVGLNEKDHLDGVSILHNSVNGFKPPVSDPWCGSFLNWIMEHHNITPPKLGCRASAWAKWGQKIDEPWFGSIFYKVRYDKGKIVGGHVGLVVGYTMDNKLIVLGGNQNDSVSFAIYNEKKAASFNFPQGFTSDGLMPNYNFTNSKKKKES